MLDALAGRADDAEGSTSTDVDTEVDPEKGAASAEETQLPHGPIENEVDFETGS